MSKTEQNSNKPNSNSAGLNLPALTKQFSDQVAGLEKFSNNSHRQFQDLVATSDLLSTNLTKLTTIVSNCSKALELLSSNNEQISSLDAKVSSQLQLLNSCSKDLEEKLSGLTKINTQLASILKSEKERTGLTTQFVEKLTGILVSHRTHLEEIKSLTEKLPTSIAQLFDEKLSTLEQNRSQALEDYTKSVTSINEQLKSLTAIDEQLKLLPTRDETSKSSRLGSIIFLGAMMLLLLLSGFNLYLSYSLSSQFQGSVDSLKRDIQAIKNSPAPSPSPSITPKADKKK